EAFAAPPPGRSGSALDTQGGAANFENRAAVAGGHLRRFKRRPSNRRLLHCGGNGRCWPETLRPAGFSTSASLAVKTGGGHAASRPRRPLWLRRDAMSEQTKKPDDYKLSSYGYEVYVCTVCGVNKVSGKNGHV